MTSPNIFFFLTDQHRVDTLPCYGNEVVRTPWLDSLAAQGTVFDRFYTPTAICTPARASLLTGQSPFRHQLLANYERNVGYKEDLEPGHRTVSADLRARGYRVGLAGKWHVGLHRTAQDCGFDALHMHGWHNPVDLPAYQEWLAAQGLPPYRLRDEIRGTFPNGGRGNLLAARLEQGVEATFERFLGDLAIAQLREYAQTYYRDGTPFFLATHFFGPHLPYNLPAEYFDMYDPDEVELPASIAETFLGKPPVQANYSAHWTFDTLGEETSRKLIAAYWGYVTMIDHEIGRIVEVARELGVYDDAAVFFSADHGEFTGSHRLHDKGPAMYEDIYRVPGVVRPPGGGPAQHRAEFADLIDLTATIDELAGTPPERTPDGTSLLPILRGEHPQWRSDYVAEFHGHHFPYPQRMLVTDRYKLIVNPESVNEFYDLRADPHELTNRYGFPECRRERDAHLALLYRRLRDRGDNFYHWMTSMYPVGGVDYDTSLGSFERTAS
ncbi:sulfatase-like hydrolase/transferase [Brachybacterium hainanense]|uniref:Sulfatase-like hydrolase/transferase n=1 Tax=Brachybacterium hainanense TaxID=1541174 RepID=A0ABV6R866_9MICO